MKSLVYVAAIQPDAGESVSELNARWPFPSHVLMVDETSLIVDPAMFKHDVADDLPVADAHSLAVSQHPTSVGAFSAKVPVAAWHSKPSFGIIAQNDRTLSPEMLRSLYHRSHTITVELPGSHLILISKPHEVANVVIRASEVDF